MQWGDTGTFYALVDNTLCPANEKVYEMLDKVFTEVAQLFPFEYIHMGGDECAKNFWEKKRCHQTADAKGKPERHARGAKLFCEESGKDHRVERQEDDGLG